jgi:hypothetical protein
VRDRRLLACCGNVSAAAAGSGNCENNPGGSGVFAAALNASNEMQPTSANETALRPENV